MTFYSIVKNNKIKLLSVIIFMFLCFLILNFQIYFFKFFFSSKIWAHRVNSIEKYEEARDLFSGVELDLVFNDLNNSFDVNHPPAESINLKLFDFLKSKKEYNNFGLWLDFKNLNESNYHQSSIKLDSIVKKLNINNKNIIVESRKPIFLDAYVKKGFKVSYYLPPDIANMKEEEFIIESTIINKLINSGKIDYISSDVNDYNFLKEKFPNTTIITWILDIPPTIKSTYSLKVSIKSFIRNLIVLSDQNVKVVLFSFKAKSGNR
ncbi:FAM151 family protein [Kaistella polysaccharea]|uniref:FAM151 family protein n=1 Tax=Kaistella polysaccharea TaxID=2878534 RepID=UPI001CF2A855|nr:FAM151 family protein [Kaistella polysaccharea]